MSRPRLGRTPDERSFVGSPSDDWIDYDFAVVRVVPHPHLEAYENVGVVVHARTTGFLAARVVTDRDVLARIVPDADHELLVRYLASYDGIARGEAECGPVALAPPSERFHWLTAPRSDVLQCSRIHGGRAKDLDATVEELFSAYVTVE